jgi:AraC family transcriptional regulator
LIIGALCGLRRGRTEDLLHVEGRPLQHDVGRENAPTSHPARVKGTHGAGTGNSKRPIPMRVAEVVVSGSIELEARAIDWLYQTWLPRSGFVPDDHPAFEAWIGRPFAHGSEHFTIACQLPVKPA